jgi:probable RNA-binding protein EIF1AD
MFDVIVASPPPTGEEEDVNRPSSSSGGKDGEGCDEISPGQPKTKTMCGVVRTRSSAPQLAFLPTKFRKLIWIKRNDYVIVECGDEEAGVEMNRGEDETEDGRKALVVEATSSTTTNTTTTTGFRYVITNILYKDQVRHIKSMGLWPSDPLCANDDDNARTTTNAPVGGGAATGTTDDDQPPDVEIDDDDDGDYSPNDRDGTYYEEDGIVFDDPLGDLLTSNTNRIASLRVMDDDSSSSEEEE